MSAAAPLPDHYAQWFNELKQCIAAARQRTSLDINRELLRLYWLVGQEILLRQQFIQQPVGQIPWEHYSVPQQPNREPDTP